VSTTRLLVLGVTRIFQPVHGHLVRRELLSWQADDWADIAPGSVYNALRSLAWTDELTEATVGILRGQSSLTKQIIDTRPKDTL
jgi:hypothetical protein